MKRKIIEEHNPPKKCIKITHEQRKEAAPRGGAGTTHPVLSSYYSHVCTLRQYISKSLISHGASKSRWKTFRSRPRKRQKSNGFAVSEDPESGIDYVLDNALVGIRHSDIDWTQDDPRQSQDFQQFTQQLSSSGASSRLGASGRIALPELVDFTIWYLFHKKHSTVPRPPHVLCQGFIRTSRTILAHDCIIPGLVLAHRNEHAETLKGPRWTAIFERLGSCADKVALDLLINCAIFMPLATDSEHLYQLSGVLLSELSSRHDEAPLSRIPKHALIKESLLTDMNGLFNRTPSQITLVRHRMFYARPAISARGKTRLGLNTTNILNRLTDANDPAQTVHLLKYIFPRQFKLHNVFTSATNPKETAQPFKDYTFRECEIARADIPRQIKEGKQETDHERIPSLPKRLRGGAYDLVRKLRVQHRRCPYLKLLSHFCPLHSSSTADMNGHFSEYATKHAAVSAFCRVSIAKVFPFALMGEHGPKGHNWRCLMRSVDAFVRLRRFESFSLQQVLDGLQLKKIEWLRPYGVNSEANMAQSDFAKRRELLSELVYYIFDSFLMPLIRSNFYVTETGTNRNELFYFRHDVWRRMTAAASETLRREMLQPLSADEASDVLESRQLGYSHIRFLPKKTGLRPITNLRRRSMTVRKGQRGLGRSINSTLGPVFHAIKYEKGRRPERLASSLFSVTDMHERLGAFRRTLKEQGLEGQKLYFVKVDVKSCYDNLPQDVLLRLASDMLSEDEYTVTRYTEHRPVGYQGPDGRTAFGKPGKRFHAEVAPDGSTYDFKATAEASLKDRCRGRVFVDGVARQASHRSQLIELLNEHLKGNMLRIGRQYYRQARGIPQGSVLSSLLCSIGYADFERKHLGFLASSPSLFMRLIDDFLLITPCKSQAERFLEVMERGSEGYGITIRRDKTLTSFGTSTADWFPYCGLLLQQATLDIARDRTTNRHSHPAQALTAEYGQMPGHSFRRKMINGLKIQMQAMLIDGKHNSRATVLGNVYGLLCESAMRSMHYIRAVSRLQRAAPRMVGGLIDSVAGLVKAKLQRAAESSRSSSSRGDGRAVDWLAAQAFLRVLRPKQTVFGQLVPELRRRVGRTRARAGGAEARLLHRVVAGIERVNHE